MTTMAEALHEDDALPEGHHELRVLDGSGDTRITWDPENADEVANAREVFNNMRGKGMVAYATTRAGEKGEVMREFDPEAEKMILAPPLRGG